MHLRSRPSAPPVLRFLRPLLCCLALYSLVVLTLESQSIWWDEGISLHLAGLSWAAIVADRAANIHPPLYFFILKIWTSLVGSSPFAGRYLSALAVTLLPAGVYRFVRRRIDDRAARVSALLVALAPPFVVYGQETRAYPMLPLGVLALWSLAWPPVKAFGVSLASRHLRDKETPRASAEVGLPSFGRTPLWLRRGVLLGAVQAALLLTHYAGAIAIGVAAILYAVTSQRLSLRGARRLVVYEWLTGAVVTLVIVSPWAVAIARAGVGGLTAQAGLGNVFAAPAPAGYVAALLGIFHTTGLPQALGDPALVRPSLLIGFLLVATIVAALLSRGQRSPGLRLALVLWLVPFLSAPVLWRFSPQSHPRYLFPFVLGGWLVAGIVATDRGVFRLVRTFLLAAVLVISLLGLRAYFTNPTYARSDVRGVAAYLNTHTQPGDVVLVPPTDWSLAQYDLGAARLVMPPQPWRGDASWLTEGAGRASRVYLLDYDRGALDPSGRLRAEVAWSGVLVSRTRFQGVFLEAYDMRDSPVSHDCAPVAPVCVGGSALCLVGVAYQTDPISGAALPVHLCWEGSGAGTRYAASVRLYAPPGVGVRGGALVSSVDGLLVDEAGAPTDVWSGGGPHASYHLLPVPVGALPEAYRLEVGLFDPSDPAKSVLLEDGGSNTAASFVLGDTRPLLSPWLDVSLYPIAAAPTSLALSVTPSLHLDGAKVDRGQVAPGDRVFVTLWWQIVGDMSADAHPAVELRQAGKTVATSELPPIRAAWPSGRPVMQVAALSVPPDAVPGRAEVVTEVDGRTVTLADVAVEAALHRFTLPQVSYIVDEGAGTVATLVGYDLAPQTAEAPETAEAPADGRGAGWRRRPPHVDPRVAGRGRCVE